MMTKKTSVLLIDDCPLTMAMTKKVVECVVKNGKIITFCSATDALSYLRAEIEMSGGDSEAPGIILSDLHMPCMDGFQFLEAFAMLPEPVRKRYSVFILSATTDEKERAQLFRKNSLDGFCSKPLTDGKLLHLLERTRIIL
jgi:CheY-like chemotaxis protein